MSPMNLIWTFEQFKIITRMSMHLCCQLHARHCDRNKPQAAENNVLSNASWSLKISTTWCSHGVHGEWHVDGCPTRLVSFYSNFYEHGAFLQTANVRYWETIGRLKPPIVMPRFATQKAANDWISLVPNCKSISKYIFLFSLMTLDFWLFESLWSNKINDSLARRVLAFCSIDEL